MNYRNHGKELKFIDRNASFTVPQNTVVGAMIDPSVGCLDGVSLGTGESARIGRIAYLKQIYIQGHVYFANGTTSTKGGGSVTFWLVQDKQTNGAQCGSDEVLLEPLDTSLAPTAFQNLQFSDRFRVLKKWKVTAQQPSITTSTGNTTVTNAQDVQFSAFCKLNNMKVEYKAAGTSAISDHTSNSLHLIAIGDNTIDGGSAIRYQCRTRFTD